jgi:hypothetical protein
MFRRNVLAAALAGAGVSLALPATAHHSFAMFDHAVTIKLNGTVKQVEWVNPHSWIHMVTTDAAGKEITWSFEAGSVAQLIQEGWKQDSVRAGDKVEMTYHPLKDGSFGGQVLLVKLPSGVTLCQGRDCRNGENYRSGPAQ